MPCCTSSKFQSNPPCFKINLIMHDKDILRKNLIKSCQRSDHIPRTVHIGLRLTKQNFLIISLSLNHLTLKFCNKFSLLISIIFISLIHKMKSDIVSSSFIVFSRISKSHDQFHSNFYEQINSENYNKLC